jgi:PPP family 3-phenylpropionic acid transporter
MAAMVLTLAAAFALAPLGPSSHDAPAARRSLPPPWREPAFLAVAAGSSLVQASHAVLYGFSTLDWQAAGLDGVTIGALWALAVLAEIVLFAISGHLSAAPTALLLIGAAGALARWGAMALDPPLALLPLLQCLHALSFGATHLAALGFIAQATRPALAARAQGYLAVAQGLAMAGAMGVSGVLYARFGGLAYGAMALLAGAGGLFALAAHFRERNQ